MLAGALGAACVVSWATFPGADVRVVNDAPSSSASQRLTNDGADAVATVVVIETSATNFDIEVDGLTEVGVAGTGKAVLVKGGHAPDRISSGDARDAGRSRLQITSGSVFHDRLSGGGNGPEMVVIPAGRFRMGCLSDDVACFYNERPAHEVIIAVPFALSVHEVTFEDYDRFTYPDKVADAGWGRGRRPVINVSWNDAQGYVAWLAAQTGQRYRLPSEAEWEYVARAGTTTKWHHGNDEAGICRYANHLDRSAALAWRNDACSDGFGKQTAPTGSFAPNAFGLYDIHGNVWEWIADCWNRDYDGAPTDGSARIEGSCDLRIVRGGSWLSDPRLVRSAARDSVVSGDSNEVIGFRVARTLAP